MRNGEAVDLVESIAQFGDDQHCRNYLEALRWPEGVRCPKCGGSKISSILKRDQYNCDNDSCRYQFSVTAGTIFHDTHLPLVKWFLATYILCQSRKGMSANQLKRMLGISYKTAWYLAHRVRAAMRAAETENGKLAGTVEIDETYVGGKPPKGSKRGRGTPKEVVIGIRRRGGDLRFFHAEDVKSGTLAKYIRENVSSDVDVVMTDQFSAYHQALAELDDKHQAINHSLGLHTNTVESAFSLLKRGIIGTWHRVSAKHLAAYLNEMTWRFNNRKNPFLFRDTIKRMLNSDNLEFKELTAAA
jgi:transposase-like protein